MNELVNATVAHNEKRFQRIVTITELEVDTFPNDDGTTHTLLSIAGRLSNGTKVKHSIHLEEITFKPLSGAHIDDVRSAR